MSKTIMGKTIITKKAKFLTGIISHREARKALRVFFGTSSDLRTTSSFDKLHCFHNMQLGLGGISVAFKAVKEEDYSDTNILVRLEEDSQSDKFEKIKGIINNSVVKIRNK